jgi:hypothetical protein
LTGYLAIGGLDRSEPPSCDKSFACGRKALRRAASLARAGQSVARVKPGPRAGGRTGEAQSAILETQARARFLIQLSNSGAFLPRPACGERSRASCERVRGRFRKAGLAERPPHPVLRADLPARGARRSKHSFAISPLVRASFANNVPPFRREGAGDPQERAQGRPGARCTRGLACNKRKEDAHEHTGSAEAVRPSLRDGLRLISCSPW